MKEQDNGDKNIDFSKYTVVENANNGDMRINNLGQLEEYFEGYWVPVDWKLTDKDK